MHETQCRLSFFRSDEMEMVMSDLERANEVSITILGCEQSPRKGEG